MHQRHVRRLNRGRFMLRTELCAHTYVRVQRRGNEAEEFRPALINCWGSEVQPAFERMAGPLPFPVNPSFFSPFSFSSSFF